MPVGQNKSGYAVLVEPLCDFHTLFVLIKPEIATTGTDDNARAGRVLFRNIGCQLNCVGI